MNSTKIVARSSRAIRLARPLHPSRQHRFQSSSSNNASSHSHSTTALYGGLAGGVFAAILGYGWYSFSGAKTAVNTAHQAKAYFESSKQKLQQAAPKPNELLDWLRSQAYFYSNFVPGGRKYVDGAFADLDTIRDKHGKEVDKIVGEAYEELKKIADQGLSISAATSAWEILQKHMQRIIELASDSASEILARHPQLKSAVGGNIDQLRSLGDSLGPDAKKAVTDTWSQIQDVVAGGVSATSLSKVKQIIEEKIEQLKKMGDETWSKGLEDLKPYLDKNPQIKELLDNNKKELVSKGTELWSKAKQAAESGNVDDLKNYVQKNVEKAKQKSGDVLPMVEKYIDDILPGGASQIMPKLNQFKELAQKADVKGLEKLVKETVDEIKALLEKKLHQGKKLVGEDKESK